MRVTIYVIRRCGYCRRAAALLEARGVPFERIDVTDSPEERRRLHELTGRPTVPQIFIDERPIGGFDDLTALDRSGELAAMVAPTP